MSLAAVAPTEISVEEFFHGEFHGYELVRGQLVEKPVSGKASYTSLQFSTDVAIYLRANPIGKPFDAEQQYACFPRSLATSPKPDVSVVLNDRLPGGRVPDGNFLIRPDLAFESVSGHDNARELELKLFDYVSVGVPLIWVVYAEARMGRVFRQDGSSVFVREEDYLDGGDVLPGFRVQLSSILPPPDPVVAKVGKRKRKRVSDDEAGDRD